MHARRPVPIGTGHPVSARGLRAPTQWGGRGRPRRSRVLFPASARSLNFSLCFLIAFVPSLRVCSTRVQQFCVSCVLLIIHTRHLCGRQTCVDNLPGDCRGSSGRATVQELELHAF